MATLVVTKQAENDIAYLTRSIVLADDAVKQGNHPFAALLVGPDGSTILAEAMNSHSVDKGPGHAEANLCRDVARRFSLEVLRQSTLYTSVEPCCMCAGTAYWTEIGTVVYGMSEKKLAILTGDDEANATMSLDCRTVFNSGKHKVAVRGPYAELEEQIVKQHKAFWK
jgi:tRNA(Arg) A34 adenosine deaminase TadA